MPKPVLLAACEKVITDSDGLISLITLIEKLEVGVPAGVDLPERIAIPMRWSVVSVWRKDADASEYEQMVDLATEDGTVAMHTDREVIRWKPGSSGAAITSILTAVPITDGPLSLRLFKRKIGEAEWVQVSEYPIEVKLVRA